MKSSRFLGIACLVFLLLGACSEVSRVGTYPDPNGPRNGDDQFVNSLTGIPLPGQPEAGA